MRFKISRQRALDTLTASGWQPAPMILLTIAVAAAAEVYRFTAVALLLVVVAAVAAGWFLDGGRLVVAAALVGAATAIGVALDRSDPWSRVVETLAVVALAAFAHLAARARKESGLAKDRERDVRDLTFLLEAAQTVSETLDRDRILAAAVRHVQQGVSRPGAHKAAHASFHALAGEEATISTVVDEPADREHILGFSYPTERNQAARGAIRSGKAAIVRPDHMSGPLLDLATRLGWQALVMAPVFSAGELLGLLAASNRDSGAVEKRQLRMLEVLARMTGLALANAEDLEQERSESLRLSEVGTVQVVNQFADQMRNALALLKTSIRGRDDDASAQLAESVRTVDRLLESVDSRTAVDGATGLLRQELGLLALKRDVARAHRTLLGRHCLAVIAIRAVDGQRPAVVLREVATALRAHLRDEDLVFLNSEKEIVCSLSDVDVETAWPIFDEIRTELERRLGGAPFNIGLTALRQEQSAEEAVAAARSAVAPLPVSRPRDKQRQQGAMRH